MAILPDEEQYTGNPGLARFYLALQMQVLSRFRDVYTTPWAPDKRYPPFAGAPQVQGCIHDTLGSRQDVHLLILPMTL